MNTRLLSIDGAATTPEQLRTAVVLVAAVTLTAVHRQLFEVSMLPQTELLSGGTARTWTYFTSTFVLFGLLPWLLVRYVLHSPPAACGLTVGDWRFGGLAIAILLPIIAVTMLVPAADFPSMRATYPVDKAAMLSAERFAWYAAGRVLLFYTAWEFFFRGLLLFGLRRQLGDLTALCLQTLPSALWHIGYPDSELYASIAGGLLFGWLALRTGSILWPFLLHAGIGLITDLSISLS
jgi:membrane protease YdiL (CAAX protease family)